MKCGKCGADNPDSAEICSLCTERLNHAGAESTQRFGASVPGEPYVSPSEWRGVADGAGPTLSGSVQSKIRRFRVKIASYAAVLAVMIFAIVLSFTVWGNPSPEKMSAMMIDAINARDTEAFAGQFREGDRQAAMELYGRITAYLGATGRYVDVGLVAERPNNYEAYTYLDRGSIEAGGAVRDISRADNLMVVLESWGGKWYVVPRGTDIIP